MVLLGLLAFLLNHGVIAADSYQVSYRDSVIKNWQSRVSDSEACKPFKDRFMRAGKRHDNAANGAFHLDMMGIWEDVKKSGCAYKP